MLYTLCIAGELEKRWELWFEGFTVCRKIAESGDLLTCLTGFVSDRAELYGTISKLRDIGLDLVSVTRLSNIKERSEKND